MDHEADERWTRLLAEVQVGDVLTGTVSSYQPFGVFVALDGWAVPGLLHRLVDCRPPVGSRVECVVTGLDHHNEVYLGLNRPD